MKTTKAVVTVLVTVILVAAVSIGAYKLNWWLKEDSVNRTSQINQDSYGRQNALVEQILDDIKDAETLGIPAGQRIAIVDQICDSAAKLNNTIPLPNSAQNFIYLECA